MITTGGNGEFFAVAANGDMYLYRHTGWETGAPHDWAPRQTVGWGWAPRFNRIFGGQDGQIYAQEPGGDLYWYEFVNGWWHPGGGTQVDAGWATWLIPTVAVLRHPPAAPIIVR